MKPKINKIVKEEFLLAIGKNIKKIRKSKGLSQLDLAINCNSDEKKIRDTEKGKYSFQVFSLAVIATGLDVELEEIIKGIFKKNQRKIIFQTTD